MQTNNGFQHGMAEIEPGVQLHYVEAGTGPRTMVLLHGFPETWWEWRDTMPLFAAAGFRVIAVDYRGAGNSSKPGDGYEKHAMAKDIDRLLTNHLGVKEPVVMVGHDIGMTVAFAFAGLFPSAVERLVLVDAIVPGTKSFHALLSTGKLHHSNLAHFFFHNARNNMAETLTAGRERVYLQDFFDRIAFNQGVFSTGVIDTYAASYAAPGGMKAGFEVYRAFDQDGEDNAAMLAASGRLKMPTLFVAGAESFLGTIAEEVLDEIAENGRVTLIPRSGHYPPEENPEAFALAVIDFCQNQDETEVSHLQTRSAPMPEDKTMELFAALLRSSMGDQLTPGAMSFLDMLADDAVMEFPFAPPGLPRSLHGKTAISKHVESLAGIIQIDSFSTPTIHRTASGFVLEFTCSGMGVQSSRPYNQDYVSVITLRDRRIVHYRDYWNPLTVLNAMEPTDKAVKEPA